jgi:NHL repeat
VYGQANMTGSAKHTGATGLSGPAAVAVDVSSGFYVADEGNNRVLHFSAPGAG